MMNEAPKEVLRCTLAIDHLVPAQPAEMQAARTEVSLALSGLSDDKQLDHMLFRLATTIASISDATAEKAHYLYELLSGVVGISINKNFEAGAMAVSALFDPSIKLYSVEGEWLQVDWGSEGQEILQRVKRAFHRPPFAGLLTQFFEFGGIGVLSQALARNSLPQQTLIVLFDLMSRIINFFSASEEMQLLHQRTEAHIHSYLANYKIADLDVWAKFFYQLSQRINKQAITELTRVKMFVIMEFLPLNLQKQIFALNLLSDLTHPTTTHHEDLKKQVNEFMVREKIFSRVVKTGAHEQMLIRSDILLGYLFGEKIAGLGQAQYIWQMFPNNDTRGRTVIHQLLTKICHKLPAQFSVKLSDQLISVDPKILGTQKFELLSALAECCQDVHQRQKLLCCFWQSLKKDKRSRTETVFVNLIRQLRVPSIQLALIKKIMAHLQDVVAPQQQLHYLKILIDNYPYERAEDFTTPHIPGDRAEVMHFVIELGVFRILSALIKDSRNHDEGTVKSILEFYDYLLVNEPQQDVSQAVSQVYKVIGPTNSFLSWAHRHFEKLTIFFTELFSNAQEAVKFKDISAKGFSVIGNMILSCNSMKKNIIMKEENSSVLSTSEASDYPQAMQVEHPVPSSQTNSSQTTSESPSFEVVKAPTECIGIHFLAEMLPIVKDKDASTLIRMFLINFITNLSKKLMPQIKQLRQSFLTLPFKNLSNRTNEPKEAVIMKVERYLNFFKQVIASSEEEGLCGIKPHFTRLNAPSVSLTIKNCLFKDQNEPFTFQVPISMTLWDFKCLISERLGMMPHLLLVQRFFVTHSGICNGQSLRDLFFNDNQQIKIKRKNLKEGSVQPLLNKDGALSDKLISIIELWFNLHKNERGEIDAEGTKKFVNLYWSGQFEGEASVEKFMKACGAEDMGGITLEGFMRFWWGRVTQDQRMVRNLLDVAGYKPNLESMDIIDSCQVPEALPRKILSQSPMYKLIFSMLQDPVLKEQHMQIYSFLRMLQTAQEIHEYVGGGFKQFVEQEPCIYRLTYWLQTILIELPTNQELFATFHSKNGHIGVINKLEALLSNCKSVYELDECVRDRMLPYLLRVITMYVLASNKRPICKIAAKITLNMTEVKDILNLYEKQKANDYIQRDYPELTGSPINENSLSFMVYSLIKNISSEYKNLLLSELTTQASQLLSILVLNSVQFRPEAVFELISSPCSGIRKSVQGVVYLHLIDRTEVMGDVINSLLANMPDQMTLSQANFYHLMVSVIRRALSIANDSPAVDEFFLNVAMQLMCKLSSRPNQPRNRKINDTIIEGLLACLLPIIEQNSFCARQMMAELDQLMRNYCFFYPMDQKLHELEITDQILQQREQPQFFSEYVKCKSAESRKLLYKLTMQFYRQFDRPDGDFYGIYIQPIVAMMPSFLNESKERTIQVGMVNYGSTCYANSMLQVLNAVTPFRNAIMVQRTQDPVINALRSMFSSLFYSERAAYHPWDLLQAFQPPINPMIQQDTTQFLNQLFDTVDKSLKDTSHADILNHLFQGKQVAEMKCGGCGARRERSETFFTYGVEIQNHTTLESALLGMMAGQVISDCHCQNCDKKTDTTKRTMLSEVPNVFFVHLKRMVFDYNSFVHRKIHSRLEFPKQFSIEPYLKEGVELRQRLGSEHMKKTFENPSMRQDFERQALHGRSKEDYLLKLKGIIVHSGAAEVGHYISVLKKNRRWIQFDDANVSYFSQSSFESCYGGDVEQDGWGGVSKNAYVLVYEKQKNELQEGRRGKLVNDTWQYKRVWRDNHFLMMENHLVGSHYSSDFMNYACQILLTCRSPRLMEYISDLIFKVVIFSGEVGKLLELFFKHTVLITEQTMTKYITDNNKLPFNLLFHPQVKVRELARAYVMQVLRKIRSICTEQNKSKIFGFVSEYLSILYGDPSKQWLKLDKAMRQQPPITTEQIQSILNPPGQVSQQEQNAEQSHNIIQQSEEAIVENELKNEAKPEQKMADSFSLEREDNKAMDSGQNQTQVSCGQCTYLNAVGMAECEMCGNPL